jgi:hypothetical protein
MVSRQVSVIWLICNSFTNFNIDKIHVQYEF